jgi:hypothetical protein
VPIAPELPLGRLWGDTKRMTRLADAAWGSP